MSSQTFATSRIATVTGDTFEALVVEGQGQIVVEFMSYGCVHCRTLEPILQRVAGELASSTQIFRVNVALDAALANQYDIEATPTLLLFLNGQELARAEGPHPSVASISAAITGPFAAVGSVH